MPNTRAGTTAASDLITVRPMPERAGCNLPSRVRVPSGKRIIAPPAVRSLPLHIVTSLTLANPTPLDLRRLPEATVEGLYVHVPFCFHKCHYCDFYSITRQSEDRMERFVELLLAEAVLWVNARAGAGISSRPTA